MSGSKRYVLDTNVFIEAKNRYYRFELCPGFWKALLVHHRNGCVCSIDKVLNELTVEGDPLNHWAKDKAPKTFFKETRDQAVIEFYQRLITWVNSEEQFMAAARAEFASVADGWVIAFAKANDLIVVTQEVYAPDAKKKIPMPNLCLEFNVDYVNTFDMLEELKAKFILSPKRPRKK